MMTDGTRREKSQRISLVPVENRQRHEERVESMRNHPSTYIDEPTQVHLTAVDCESADEE